MNCQDGYWLHKTIVLNSKYPIVDDNDSKIGETDNKDIALITYADSKEG